MHLAGLNTTWRWLQPARAADLLAVAQALDTVDQTVQILTRNSHPVFYILLLIYALGLAAVQSAKWQETSMDEEFPVDPLEIITLRFGVER